MPTPTGTAVSLGDRTVFPRLVTATAPRVEKRYAFFPSFGVGASGGGMDSAARAGSVQVVVSQVGPFTVSTLSSSDPGAVNTWLADHGYPTKPELTGTFGLYLAKGWSIQAVRLTSPGGQLTGDLDPLRMTFPATTPVYPILLSKHASDTQVVTLYVAAAHRMQVATTASANAYTTQLFAGRVPAAQLGITALYGDAVYLTAFIEVLVPDQITADYTFRQASDDTDYQRVVYEDVDVTWAVPLGAFGLLVVGVILVVWYRTRRKQVPGGAGPTVH